MASRKVLHIDVVSDVICPWCWVGKRKLEAAMADAADRFDFVVRWEPFLLRPDTPVEGAPLPAAYSDLSNPRVAQLRDAGEAVGINFTFKATRVPNTVQAHALLDFFKTWEGGKHQNDASERLFKMRFIDGCNLTENELLLVADEFHLPHAKVQEYLTNSKVLASIRKQASGWSNKGINGVPFFYMNGNRMCSGAQEKETFLRMFEIATEKSPAQVDSKT